MTEKRARTPLSKVRIPFFEREYTPVKPPRMRARFKTVDDVVFEVSDASIVPSTYMNRLIYGSRMNKQQMSDITHPLPNVAADVFEKVMCYCYFHTSKYCDGLLPNQVKEWDDQFMDLDPRQLCELASAAYYLDVKDLIELTCRAIAAIISGKSAEQIRKTFHIENDLAGTIDRVLPTSARRRGREHSPREGVRQADSGQDVSHGQTQNDISQQNPGPQKTVDEIIEWIDSTSSKSQKKKKKKRRKDKNPSKKGSDNLGNDDEICELDPSHLTTINVQAETEGQVTTEDHHVAHKNELSGYKANAEDSDTPKGSNQNQALLESDISRDDESSNSDIAIVSEKIVNPRAIVSGKGTTQNPETSRDAPVSEERDYRGLQAAHISTSPTTDAVEWTQHESPLDTQAVKQENKLRNRTSGSDESTDHAEMVAPQQNGASESGEGVENGNAMLSDHGIPSRVDAKERGENQTLQPEQKDDVTMKEGPQNRALRSEQVSEEPFIDCPENMDREVEDFQQRLSITEPLSSHLHIPQTQNSTVHPQRKGSHSVHPSTTDINGSWVTNGTVPEVSVTPYSTSRLESTPRTDVLPSTDACRRLQEMEGSQRHDTQVKGPSIPKQVLAELLRINSEKEEYEKIATAIDEETARLGAKREKVRDTLAFLNMQERQLRTKYKLSDRFP